MNLGGECIDGCDLKTEFKYTRKREKECSTYIDIILYIYLCVLLLCNYARSLNYIYRHILYII